MTPRSESVLRVPCFVLGGAVSAAAGARWRSQAGVSIVELMVATALLSIVMAAAYSNLIAQIRTHATQQLTTESMHDARTASW